MLNKVILQGRLTADAELKYTPSGTQVTSFSIAVERNFANKEDGTRGADFINIVAWRNTAEFVSKYFSKGKMIIVEGSIQTRKYEDKNGNNRVAFEVVAEQVYFAGDNKPTGAGQGGAPSAPTQGRFDPSQFEEVPIDDSDLPF